MTRDELAYLQRWSNDLFASFVGGVGGVESRHAVERSHFDTGCSGTSDHPRVIVVAPEAGVAPGPAPSSKAANEPPPPTEDQP